jgi:Ca2+-binding RTX toxin-like protein
VTRLTALLAACALLLGIVAVAQAATIPGTSGSNRLSGTSGGDLIDGGRGNDRINGRGGNDILKGGAGRDDITGGSGWDLVQAGIGDDLVDARDGRADRAVICDAGLRDVVYADRSDPIDGSCEVVRYRARPR